MQGCICPHPPLLIPAIGGDNRRRVAGHGRGHGAPRRRDGAATWRRHLAAHARLRRRAVGSARAGRAGGRLRRLSLPRGGRRDRQRRGVRRTAARRGRRGDASPSSRCDDELLDHGVLVPLFFLSRAAPREPLGGARLRRSHATLGRLVRETADELGRDVAVRGLRRPVAPPPAGRAGGLRPARRAVRRRGRRAARRAATSTASAGSTPSSCAARGSAACARSSRSAPSWATTPLRPACSATRALRRRATRSPPSARPA